MVPSSQFIHRRQACPHIVCREVFGKPLVAQLIEFIGRRKSDFGPTYVRDRSSGKNRVDADLRSSLGLGDLGPFREPLDAYVRGIAGSALARLSLTEPSVEPRDFQVTAFRDGDRFGAHIDTDDRLTRVRILSCVYYFAAEPRRFSGGELRLYGLPALSADGVRGFVDVMPETDTMVIFPSWLRHEVLPVRVPSGEWAHSRFTLNCWLHRAAANGVSASAS